MARRTDHFQKREFFKVLLPSCLQNLRLPRGVARELCDGNDDYGGSVLVIGALGRMWRVEVRQERDDGGGGAAEAMSFLVRGWAEFARAHGVGVGWFVVFRHEGRGVLSVKAFDNSLCRREFCTPCSGLTGKNMVARPQFIGILLPELYKKMPIPPRFVRNYMAQDDASQEAMVFSPLGKFWCIGLEHGRSHVFFGSGWAEFLTAHGVSKGHLLLFKYEGNMVFTVKVFEPSGRQKEYYGTSFSGDRPQAEKQQPEVSSTSRKRKCASESASHAGHKKPECSLTSVNEKKAHPKPMHLTTRIITAAALKQKFMIGRTKCASIGLPTSCTITLKTSAKSERSWKATFRTANTYCYFQAGWKEFCRDNDVREGDQYTIDVIGKTLWLVRIRSK